MPATATGFNQDARSVLVSGHSVADVAEMQPAEVSQLLGNSGRRRIMCMERVGLGHLSVGRSLDTLSGGERQRLLLAQHLADAETGASHTLKILSGRTDGRTPWQ
jgi:excinuclease UvrABC ATPase subunit